MQVVMILLGIILGAGNYALNIANCYPPFGAKLARLTYKEHPDLIPQTEQLIRGAIKGDYDLSQYLDLMRLAGFDSGIAEKLLRSARQLLTVYDYITLWRREEIDEEQLAVYLREAGLNDDYHELVKKATLYYPQPQDLVRFAVREVFTPDTAEKYGLFEDLPSEFIDAGKKAGLSEDFATMYWGAHWQLPSPYQAYEMLHRGLITEDELLGLLKAADFMPFWREKLKDISYNVITRVDVRRMFQAGVYSETQVLDTYKKMGYNPQDAQDLTAWTVKTYQPKTTSVSGLDDVVETEDKEILPSQSLIVRSYSKGLITREEAIKRLDDLNYSTASANMILNIADDTLKQEIIDIQADELGNRYRDGEITLDAFRAGLTSLGVTSRYMEIILNREIAQATKRVKLPTRADLEAWLKKGIIESDVYVARMRAFGYADEDIELYLQEVIYDMGGTNVEEED